jgi:tape measure domain-containing protein
MVTNDILSVLISIQGVDIATRDLQRVQDELQDAADGAAALAAAGAGVAIAGGLIATAAVIEAEKFAKLEKSLEGVAKADVATGLANEIRSIARETGVWDSHLEEVASTWADITGSADGIQEVTKAVATLSATNKLSASEMERVTRALADAQANGVVSQSNINALRNAGAPVAKMADDLGLDSINEAKGIRAAEFVNSFIKSVGEAEATFTGALRGSYMAIQHALVPTGALISQIFLPVAKFTQALAEGFVKLNTFTRGWAGLLVVIGLVGGGLRMMWVAARMMIKGLWDASWALQALATSARAAATANATSGTASAAGSAAGAAGAAAGWAGIAAMLTRVGGIIMTTLHVLKFVFTTVILPILGVVAAAVAIIGGIAAIGIWIINGIANIAKGKHFNDGVAETVGGGVENVKKFGRWATGQKEPGDVNKPKPADRAIQRSSIENVWDKAYGRRMST